MPQLIFIQDRHNYTNLVPTFTVGGGKCRKYIWDKCDWIDYQKIGGNCLAEYRLISKFALSRMVRRQSEPLKTEARKDKT